jgi:hypothetical protein
MARQLSIFVLNRLGFKIPFWAIISKKLRNGNYRQKSDITEKERL